MHFYRWPIGRIPLWIAYKVPPVRWAALGVSKAIESILPAGRYTAGINMGSYVVYKDVQRRLAEPKIKIRVLYTAKNQETAEYAAEFQVDASCPKKLARLIRRLRQSIHEYVKEYGDPRYYVCGFLPPLVDLSLAIPQLEFEALEAAAKKVIAGYHDKYKDPKSGRCLSLPVFVKSLAVMFKPARAEFAVLIREGKVAENQIAEGFMTVLGKLGLGALRVPRYYQKDAGTVSDYLGRLFIHLMPMIKSAEELKAWSQEIAEQVNAFTRKYERENPVSYATFLVLLAQHTGGFRLFRASKRILDAMIGEYHERIGRLYKNHSFYVKALLEALKKINRIDREGMLLLQSYDRVIKEGMARRLQALVAVRQSETVDRAKKGQDSEFVAAHTLERLLKDYYTFLSKNLLGWIETAESPEHLAVLMEQFFQGEKKD